MAIERSLILLKPDCLDGHHAGEVIGRFEKAGFEIRATKLIALTDELPRSITPTSPIARFFRRS